MRKLRFGFFLMGIAVAAIPASATITFSYCTGAPCSTGGTYSGWQSELGTSGLTLTPTSLISFVSGGLNGSTGIYTDTGT